MLNIQLSSLEKRLKTAVELGLSEKDLESIKKELGRNPNYLELCIFSTFWSSTASFDPISNWMRILPREGNRIFSESTNTLPAVLAIGDKLACMVKAVAHDVDPYQTLYSKGFHPSFHIGAVPIRNNDETSLKEANNFDQGAIPFAANMGVQVKTGYLTTHQDSLQSKQAHSFAIGIGKLDETLSNDLKGAGNPLFYLGDLPFWNKENGKPTAASEKKLKEAVIEAIQSGVITGTQNIVNGNVLKTITDLCVNEVCGMTIQLDQLIDPSCENEELLDRLFEIDRGFVLACVKGEEATIEHIFEKWDVRTQQIGVLNDDGLLQFIQRGVTKAEIPIVIFQHLKSQQYTLPKATKPKYLNKVRQFNNKKVKSAKNIVAAAKHLFACPEIVYKSWSHTSLTNEVEADLKQAPKSADAAILRLNDKEPSLLFSFGGDVAHVAADPYVGGLIAVASAIRSIICSGGIPIGAANFINIGDFDDPEMNYCFEGVLKAIGDAARKFGIPFIDDQVQQLHSVEAKPQITNIGHSISLNIGMLGLLEHPDHLTTKPFKSDGDIIYMLGNLSNDFGSSVYLRKVLNVDVSSPPFFDLHEEFEIQRHIRKLILKKIVHSAHQISKGGLFTALMECAIEGAMGFDVETVDTFRKDAFLFGESQGRILITLAAEQEDALQNYLINNNVSFTKLGEVFGNEAVINGENFGHISDWKRIHEDALTTFNTG